MQVNCRRTCASLFSCCESVRQTLATAVVKLNEARCDPEGFQRICLIALSIIQGINYCASKDYLPQLVRVLDTANSLDFYGFLKIPYHFFHVVDSDKIDELKILNALETILCHNWNQGEMTPEGRLQDPEVRAFAQNCLGSLLEQMNENDWAYQDTARFKQALQTWLFQELVLNPNERAAWSPDAIDLSSLEVFQKEDSWFETLTNFTFMGVDVICLPGFLQEWNLVDLAYHANWIGQYPLLGWVPNHKLDNWVRAGLCLGFLLKFLEACRCLRETAVGETTVKKAKWSLVVSAAEFVFNFSILCRAKFPVIVALTFVAKTLGVMSIMYKPPMHFLEGTD